MKTITFKLPIFHISLNFHSTQTQNQQMGKPKVQNFKHKQATHTGQWYELPEKKKNFLQKLSQTHYSKARPLHHHHLEPHVREQEHEGQESEEFQRFWETQFAFLELWSKRMDYMSLGTWGWTQNLQGLPWEYERERERESRVVEIKKETSFLLLFIYEGLDVEAELSFWGSVTLLLLKHWQVTPYKRNISYI